MCDETACTFSGERMLSWCKCGPGDCSANRHYFTKPQERLLWCYLRHLMLWDKENKKRKVPSWGFHCWALQKGRRWRSIWRQRLWFFFLRRVYLSVITQSFLLSDSLKYRRHIFWISHLCCSLLLRTLRYRDLFHAHIFKFSWPAHTMWPNT